MNDGDILSETQSFFEKKYPYLQESNNFPKKLTILYNKYNKRRLQQTNTLTILSIIKNQLETKYPQLKNSKNFEFIIRELLKKITKQQNSYEILSIQLANPSDLFDKGWKLNGQLLNQYNKNYIPNGVL